jgi:hypothetical protein
MYLGDISWETGGWVADAPTRLASESSGQLNALAFAYSGRRHGDGRRGVGGGAEVLRGFLTMCTAVAHTNCWTTPKRTRFIEFVSSWVEVFRPQNTLHIFCS